jgi:hypothetical protein
VLQGGVVIKTMFCVAVDTASHQHGLELCAVCGRPGIMLKSDKAILNLYAFTWQKSFKVFLLGSLHIFNCDVRIFKYVYVLHHTVCIMTHKSNIL